MVAEKDLVSVKVGKAAGMVDQEVEAGMAMEVDTVWASTA